MAQKSVIGLMLITLIACQRAEPPQSKSESQPPPPPRLDRDSTPVGSYAPIVDRVAPSVVTIRSARRLRPPRQFPFFNDPRLGELFGGLFGAPVVDPGHAANDHAQPVDEAVDDPAIHLGEDEAQRHEGAHDRRLVDLVDVVLVLDAA